VHFTDNDDHHPTSSAPRRTTLALLSALCAAPAAWLAGCASPAPAPTPAPPARKPAPAPAPAPKPTTGPVARTWDEFRLNAAKRLVAANSDITYTTPAPDPLLAIPVLEAELRADGSIAKIEVLRYPRQAKDTTQIAIDAMRRAAPFGDVSRLPKPWKYVETFLFDDDRRFKPVTLDR
jgi:hypothetical protein